MRRTSTVAFAPALHGDLHDPAFQRGCVIITVDVVAADHVEDYIRPLCVGRGFGRGDEILGLIVNGRIRAEPPAGRAFFIRPGGRNHARAECLGKLDGSCADAGGAAMDEQRLACLQSSALEDVVPDREEGFRDSRRLDER